MGIKLAHVTKKFGEVVALSDISIEVADGEYLVILGPTGAGKTTLLRVLAGLEEVDMGEVYINGRSVIGTEPEERDVVYLSQTYSLFPHMNVWENTAFGPEVRNWDPRDRERLVTEMLNLVHLEERIDAYPNELSGGMKQRNALARALSTNVRILLLDEPLRALDARLRLELRNELRRMSRDLGITALHVTHDQEEALTLADRIVVLRAGRIIQIGTPEEIYERPATPFVMHFVGEANFFTGRIVQKSKEESVVRCNGLDIHALASNLSEGTSVCVGVKTERCLVSEEMEKRDNTLRGKIERSLFLGRLTSMEIKTEYGMVKAKMPSTEIEEISEGSEVVIHFDRRHAIVFPMPAGGLRRELEVE